MHRTRRQGDENDGNIHEKKIILVLSKTKGRSFDRPFVFYHTNERNDNICHLTVHMRLLSFTFFLLLMQTVWAQPKGHVKIQFVPTFSGKPIVLEEQVYHFSPTDSIVFETFRFYISNINLYQDNKQVVDDKNPPRLLDLSNPMTLEFEVAQPAIYNSIHFDLGVDSATNVSGALGGDLDPTKGMYWTWQSGYINLKLEGVSNLCPTRNNAFEFHFGGYNGPTNALQSVILKTENKGIIRIEIPLDKFFKQIDLSKQNAVMIPGKEAVGLSAIFSQIFSIINE